MQEGLAPKLERWQLRVYGEKSWLGEDDVLLGTKYTTTAICTSQKAEVLKIPREKFLAWLSNPQMLAQWHKEAKEKR